MSRSHHTGTAHGQAPGLPLLPLVLTEPQGWRSPAPSGGYCQTHQHQPRLHQATSAVPSCQGTDTQPRQGLSHGQLTMGDELLTALTGGLQRLQLLAICEERLC